MKKIKKNLATLVLIIALLPSNDAKAVKITFGTKCHPDGTGACVGERGICLIIEMRKVDPAHRVFHPNSLLGDDMALGDLVLLSRTTMRLDIMEQRSDAELNGEFIVESDIRLNDEICRELGVNTATIRAGIYSVDYSMMRYGAVVLNIRTQ